MNSLRQLPENSNGQVRIILILALGVVAACYFPAESLADDKPAVSVKLEFGTQEITAFDPLFVRVSIRNDSKQEINLWPAIDQRCWAFTYQLKGPIELKYRNLQPTGLPEPCVFDFGQIVPQLKPNETYYYYDVLFREYFHDPIFDMEGVFKLYAGVELKEDEVTSSPIQRILVKSASVDHLQAVHNNRVQLDLLFSGNILRRDITFDSLSSIRRELKSSRLQETLGWWKLLASMRDTTDPDQKEQFAHDLSDLRQQSLIMCDTLSIAVVSQLLDQGDLGYAKLFLDRMCEKNSYQYQRLSRNLSKLEMAKARKVKGQE